MAAVPSPRTEIKSLRAALVFQAVQLNEPLKAALAGAGVDVIYETRADGIDREGLKSSEPQVFVINLDPELEDHLDELTELLDEYDRPVIFNDAAASNTLSGWDQARWARHMAAKIRGEVDSHPPRPAGATMITSPLKAVPVAVVPPVVASVPQEVAAVAQPVSAAVVVVTPASAVAAVTASVPVATAPVAAAILAVPAAAVPSNASGIDVDVDAMFADFLVEPAPAARPLAPTVEIPVVQAPAARWNEPTRELAVPPAPIPDLAEMEFDLETSVPAPVVADTDFADFGDFDQAQTDSSPSLAAVSTDWDNFAETPSTDEFGAGLDQAFADFELPPAPARNTAELTDLDELFREMAPPPAATTVPTKAAPATAPTIAEKKPGEAAPRKLAELKAPPMDWSLEPLDGEGLASLPAPTGRAQFQLGQEAKVVVPPAPPPAPVSLPAASADVADADLAAFDFFFEPSGVPVEQPAAASSAAPAPAPIKLDDIPDFGFALDPIEEAEPSAVPFASAKPVVAPVRSPAVAAPAASPVMPKPVAPIAAPAPAPASQELGGFDFDFDGFGAPESASKPDSRALEAAALADLDGLFADIEAPPVVNDIPNLDRVWILGASIGGPEAVRSFLAGLKKSLPTAFILAQHMGAEFLDLMVSQLAKASPLPVKVARVGERLQNGDVLVAPVGKRLTLDAQGRIQLGELPNDTAYSPSIDQIMFDMADRFGPRCSAVIFSGMASDAIEGAKYIASKGGRIWVQDPSTCVISSMIDGAQAAGVVNYVGSPEQLAEHLQAHLA